MKHKHEHTCDECGLKVKRHVFCGRACNNKYFNKARYISDKEVLSVEIPKITSEPVELEVVPVGDSI